MDWCCLGRFDVDPAFCRLLDAGKGGFFALHPVERHKTERAYLPGTNILRTVFSTTSGKASVSDFMPIGRSPKSSVHDYVTLHAPHWLVRIVEGLEGSVRFCVRYRPSVEFARRRPQLEMTTHGVAVDRGPFLHTDVALSPVGDQAEGTFDVAAGYRQSFVVSPRPPSTSVAPAAIDRLLEVTRAFWREWLSYCRYRGPYCDMVQRSALVLKLLTYAPTGAIVAAPTTSLPEVIGGERNWDYRYCWPRDVTFTLFALASLGYSGEARRFATYLQESCRATHPHVQIMYGIGQETELTEQSFEHLEGYRGSLPVRVGNAAFRQRQHDVYGEILDWALLYRALGERPTKAGRALLSSMADLVAQEWRNPEQGIWEMRGPPLNHVFGKIMAWVAVDRAMRMFGRREAWKRCRDEILRSVQNHGVQQGHFVQTYEGGGLDAALLLAPMVGFPADRRVLEATVEQIERRLRRGDYVKRYAFSDSLSREEGAFLVCSFWLVDALLWLDRPQEARELFERLLHRANDVGLYSEEIHPETHEFLGNFPQALTHLGLVNSAVHLSVFEQSGVEALRGTWADRARYTVERTAGLCGLWSAFRQTGRVGRFRSSRASMLAESKYCVT